jgi:hypothetical protein
MFCIFRDRCGLWLSRRRCLRRRWTGGWRGRGLLWDLVTTFSMPSSLCGTLLAKLLQGCLCESALRALNSPTSDEDEILPRKQDTNFNALYKPLRPDNLHMLELANLGRREGTSDHVSALHRNYFREVRMACGLHYAHKGLLVNIGLVGPTILDDHLTQFLNRGFCPTVDLTPLSTSANKTREGWPT